MRVLYLIQWFEPEPAFKAMAFAGELKRRGIDVEAVTGFPNYPGGKVYPGYRIRLLQRESMDGVEVTRVPLYPSHDRSSLRRALNYLSFWLSSTIYMLFFMKRVDVMHIYHPPLTVPFAGLIVSKLRRIPYVVDVQDLWPDTLETTGMVKSGLLRTLVGWVADRCYAGASAITVNSDGFKQRLIERGVPAHRISVILNWANEAVMGIKADEIQQIPVADRPGLRLLYAGTIGLAQDIDTLVEAAAILEARGVRDIEITLVGDGVDLGRIKRFAAERELSSVRFIPRVPMEQVGGLMKDADALLVILKDDPLFRITIPSKLQAYMYAGKPIVNCVAGDAAALVDKAGCGVNARPGDPESLANALTDLRAMAGEQRRQMGASGRRYYNTHLSHRVGMNAFEAILRDVGGSRTSETVRPV